LVTGVDGQVGSAFTTKATDDGYEIISISRANWDMAVNPEVGESLVFHHRPDAVVNCAAYTDVDGAEDNQRIAFSVNASAPKSLALGCESLNIPIIQLSTDYVFDGNQREPYREIDQPNPKTAYGRSKLEGEFLVRDYDKHIILRVAWVFSAEGENFVTKMFRLLQERGPVKVVDDQLGSPTSASSIAITISEILSQYKVKKDLNWGTFNFCGNEPVTRYEFTKQILKLLDVAALATLLPCKTSEFQTRAPRPMNSAMVNDKIFRVFGIGACDWKDDATTVVKQLLKDKMV
jgi:dTDP-4-dehydrorhamnose reductase